MKCWVFSKNDSLESNIKDILNISYMKNEFLPKNRIFYTEHPDKFLKAIFTNAELEDLNKEISYPSGKDIIYEMNFDNRYGFRYEEEAEYFIKKRLIYEFIREFLLLKNKDHFSDFKTESSSFDFDKSEKVNLEIDKIIKKIEKSSDFYINHLLREMSKNNILM